MLRNFLDTYVYKSVLISVLKATNINRHINIPLHSELIMVLFLFSLRQPFDIDFHTQYCEVCLTFFNDPRQMKTSTFINITDSLQQKLCL